MSALFLDSTLLRIFQHPLSYLYFVHPVACVCIIFLYVDILIIESIVFCMKPIFSW